MWVERLLDADLGDKILNIARSCLSKPFDMFELIQEGRKWKRKRDVDLQQVKTDSSQFFGRKHLKFFDDLLAKPAHLHAPEPNSGVRCRVCLDFVCQAHRVGRIEVISRFLWTTSSCTKLKRWLCWSF